MKRVFNLIIVVVILASQGINCSVFAVGCGDVPVTCIDCLSLCGSCDQPAEWTCSVEAAQGDPSHICFSYCL